MVSSATARRGAVTVASAKTTAQSEVRSFFMVPSQTSFERPMTTPDRVVGVKIFGTTLEVACPDGSATVARALSLDGRWAAPHSAAYSVAASPPVLLSGGRCRAAPEIV